MFSPKGSLQVTFDWKRSPQVEIRRGRDLVGTAQLSPIYGLMDGKEHSPMAADEWKIAKERALAWTRENPKPA